MAAGAFDVPALLIIIILANYPFTAAGFAFTWHVYKLVTNHHEHRFTDLEERLKALESPDSK
jgi:hypothetical protein